MKTDKRDARALAEACAAETYRVAHRTAEARRQLKARLAVRDALAASMLTGVTRDEKKRAPRFFGPNARLLACPCGGRRRLLAAVTSPSVAEKVLRELGRLPPPGPPPTGPPPPQLSLGL